MEHEQLLVWLEAVPDGPPPAQVGMICRRHADGMVVRGGGTLDERGESRPRLFKVVAPGVDRRSEMRRPRVRAVAAPAEPAPQLVFDDVEEDEESFVDAITVG